MLGWSWRTLSIIPIVSILTPKGIWYFPSSSRSISSSNYLSCGEIMKCFISHGPRSDLNALDCLHWKEGMCSFPIVSLEILVKHLVQKKTLKSRFHLQLWLLGKIWECRWKHLVLLILIIGHLHYSHVSSHFILGSQLFFVETIF